jgi:biopolymer transport protein ExbD
MKIQRPPTKKARIEIIPMIDAIFFLLVFFMFSSLSMVKMKGVGVALPTEAKQGGTNAMTAPNARSSLPVKTIVTVTDKNEYFINRRRVSSAELGKSLQADISAHPGAVVVVNVAKSQSAQSLINVMDSVNRIATPSGAPLQVMIATEPVDLDGNALGSRAPR